MLLLRLAFNLSFTICIISLCVNYGLFCCMKCSVNICDRPVHLCFVFITIQCVFLVFSLFCKTGRWPAAIAGHPAHHLADLADRSCSCARASWYQPFWYCGHLCAGTSTPSPPPHHTSWTRTTNGGIFKNFRNFNSLNNTLRVILNLIFIFCLLFYILWLFILVYYGLVWIIFDLFCSVVFIYYFWFWFCLFLNYFG